MNVRYATDSEKIHFNSVLVDLHAHPSFRVSLFHRTLTSRNYPSCSALDPFSMRTDFAKLQKGGVDVMLSVMLAPEKGILKTKGGCHVSDRK